MVEYKRKLTKVNGELRKEISELKLTEKKLRESDKKYRKLMEAANDAIFIVDTETGIILDANKQVEVLLGIPAEEIIGMHYTKVHPVEEGKRIKKLFKKYVKINKSITSEDIFVQHKDGRKIPVEISISVFKLEGKKVIHGIFRDVTERKRYEDQLRKLSCAVEQSSSTVVITDIKGNIEYVNPKFTRLTGYTLEETVGKNPRILKSGKTPPEKYERLWKAITSGREWHGEFCNKKKNGELYLESASISPIKNDEGVITHFIAVKEDITERKKAEGNLRRITTQLTNVVNSTPDLIFVKDMELRTIMCNEAFAKAIGKKPEDVIGKTDVENGWDPELVYGNPEKGIRGFENDDRQALNGHEVHNPYDPANVGNEIRIFDTRKLPLRGADGQIIGVLGIARDITERKKTEELLQEHKKTLEQKNTTLNDVLGQLEIEKKQIKDNVIANAENLLLPIIQKLRLKGESRKYVQLLRKNLQELTSSFGTKLTEKKAKLTSREIEICNMIKNGLTNKEIASLLNISLRTAEKHRINIRKKLGIVNKDINLASFLKTL